MHLLDKMLNQVELYFILLIKTMLQSRKNEWRKFKTNKHEPTNTKIKTNQWKNVDWKIILKCGLMIYIQTIDVRRMNRQMDFAIGLCESYRLCDLKCQM